MDSNRLRYFLVLNQTESIRKASEVLHISAAALSKAIKQLEYEVGATLIVPAGRGIMITQEGRELARQAEPLLDGLEKLRQDLKEKKRSKIVKTPPVRIGSFEVFTTHFLKNIIEHLPKDSELLLREVAPGEMEKSLLAHEIDYGITYLPIPMSGVSHRQVGLVEMKIFALAKIFNKRLFQEIPFVIPVQPVVGTPNKVQGLDGWPDGEIERRVEYKVSMLESALELCREGKAAAYLPTFVVDLHNHKVKTEYQLHSLPLPSGMKIQKQAVYIAKRKSDPEDQIFKSLIKGIKYSVK